MDNFQERKQPSLLSGLCRTSDGDFEPEINSAEAQWVDIPCDQDIRYNQPTCQDEELDAFVNEINGLKLNTPLTSRYELSADYIPILDSGTLDLPPQTLSHHPVVGVGIKDIVSGGMMQKDGAFHETEIKGFHINHTARNSLRNKEVILFGSSRDVLIEHLWRERNEAQIFKNIYAMNFDAVAGLNFSSFIGECPVGQLINNNKSLEFALLTETKSQTPAIPHVYATNKYQVERWKKYFKNQTNTRLIYVNAQMQKSKEDRANLVMSVKALLSIRPDISVLLEGFHLHEAHRFGHLLSRIHFADKMPIKHAQFKTQLKLNPETAKIHRKKNSSLPVEKLIPHNIRQRQAQIELQKKQVVPDYSISEEVSRILRSPDMCICAS